MQKLNFTTFLNKICRELRKIRETDWLSCKNHKTKKKKIFEAFLSWGSTFWNRSKYAISKFWRSKLVCSMEKGSEYKTRGGEKS